MTRRSLHIFVDSQHSTTQQEVTFRLPRCHWDLSSARQTTLIRSPESAVLPAHCATGPAARPGAQEEIFPKADESLYY